MDRFELDQEHNGMLEVVVEFPDLEEAALADEQAMLRYEEHITELLVTISDLNGRIEELQHSGGREEDEFLEQCSQYTSSLPRCVWQSKRLETTPHLNKECESMHLSGEEESSELFAELQQVVASLENVVSCRRSRTLSLQSTEGAADTDLRSVSTNVENWSLEQWSEAFEALDDMEGAFGECSALTVEEQSWYKAEVSAFREKNLALKLALGGKETEIDRSKAALRTFQEERDRLQRKVKDLQETLQRAESPPSLPSSRSSSFSGAVSPRPEEENWVFHHSSQDTITTVQSLIHCLQNCSRLRHLCPLLPLQPGMLASENKVKELEAQIEYLRGCIDKLKCLNDLLVVTLEECKSDSEKISMMLGKQESNSTALHLAMQASERRIVVHDLLQMKAERNQELFLRQVTNGQPVSPDGILKCQLSLEEFESKKEMVLSEAKVLLHKIDLIPASEDSDSAHPTQVSSSNGNHFGLSCEEEQLLKDYIFRLGQDQVSIKVTLVELALKGCPQPMDVMRINEVIKAKVDDAMEASLDILPGYAVKPNLDRAQLLQNLSALREEMADLKTELYLREKEKRGLELQAMAHGHQEAAYSLLTEHLKWELEAGSEWCPPLVRSGINAADSSSCTEGDGESPTDSNEPDDECDEGEDPGMMQELMQSLARCNALQSQIEELSLALEKSAREEYMKKGQSIELTTDFFRAHSNLVSAYKNSRRKQVDQLRRLENQVELMSRRHMGQVRSLRQRVERLEAGRAARVLGETSL